MPNLDFLDFFDPINFLFKKGCASVPVLGLVWQLFSVYEFSFLLTEYLPV